MVKMLLPGLACLALLACGPGEEKPAQPADKDIGGQAADISADTDALAAANAAAGEVVRAAGDCEAVKAALPGANTELDEIEKNVRTFTGKTTLAALRKRVNDIAQLCP